MSPRTADNEICLDFAHEPFHIQCDLKVSPCRDLFGPIGLPLVLNFENTAARNLADRKSADAIHSR